MWDLPQLVRWTISFKGGPIATQ